jgi:hypothetical protein
MKLIDKMLGKKDKPDGTKPPTPSSSGYSPQPAPVASYSAGPLEQYARRACQETMSISVRMSEITRLVNLLRDELLIAYPHLEAGEAFSHASSDLILRCPNCGQLNNQVVSYLYLAGSGMMQNAIFGGPNVAAMAQGRCPGCGGSTIQVTFSPEKIQAQMNVAKAAAAAAQGMPQLSLAFPGLPYLRSLAVSPDEKLVCCVAPGGNVLAYDSETGQQRWSLPVPSARETLCRFVSVDRLLVLSEKLKDQPLVQLVNTANGSVVAETLGPKAYYGNAEADPRSGMFVGESSYDILLIIQTAGDKIEASTVSCGQIYGPGPRIGPDKKCYVLVQWTLYRIEDNRKVAVMDGDHCISFKAPSKIFCGGGYSDRSGESALHLGDLTSGETTSIPWGNEPIDEILPGSDERVLIANTVSEVHAGRYPNAVVTMFSVANRQKEWTITVGDIKPWRSVLLACAPRDGWALINTGSMLKLVGLEDGSIQNVIPKPTPDYVTAKYLGSKRLLYIARNPERDKPGALECYKI